MENKIYTEKTRKLRQNTQKIAIFCVITAKYTVNCQFFALNLSKFTPAKKNLHGDRDKYQVCVYIGQHLIILCDESDDNDHADSSQAKSQAAI